MVAQLTRSTNNVGPYMKEDEFLRSITTRHLGEVVLFKLVGMELYGVGETEQMEADFLCFLRRAELGASNMFKHWPNLEDLVNANAFKAFRTRLNTNRKRGPLDIPGCGRQIPLFIATFESPATASKAEIDSLVRFASTVVEHPLLPDITYQESLNILKPLTDPS